MNMERKNTKERRAGKEVFLEDGHPETLGRARDFAPDMQDLRLRLHAEILEAVRAAGGKVSFIKGRFSASSVSDAVPLIAVYPRFFEPAPCEAYVARLEADGNAVFVTAYEKEMSDRLTLSLHEIYMESLARLIVYLKELRRI